MGGHPSYNGDCMKQPEITPESAHREYWLSKAKLPKTLSYPLKRSMLDAALKLASVYGSVYSVHYTARTSENQVLEANFGPEPMGNFGAGRYFDSGKVLITIWAVQAQERMTTERILVEEGLPILCRWLAKAQAEGNAWRGSRHSLSLAIINGQLRHTEL